MKPKAADDTVLYDPSGACGATSNGALRTTGATSQMGSITGHLRERSASTLSSAFDTSVASQVSGTEKEKGSDWVDHVLTASVPTVQSPSGDSFHFGYGRPH